MNVDSAPNYINRLASIRAVVFDVDGILTDGRTWLGCDGTWRRSFNVRDGLGIKRLLSAGINVAWITGSKAPDISARAAMLGVDFLSEGQESKRNAMDIFLNDFSLSESQIAYIGDDLPDLPLMKTAGFSATVPDACEELIAAADYITKNSGGFGAAREVCDLVLKHAKFVLECK